MSIREDILAEVEQFLRQHNMPPTTFGRMFMNDTAFVSRIRAGQGPNARTIDRIRASMKAYRSPGAPRSRPRKTEGAAA